MEERTGPGVGTAGLTTFVYDYKGSRVKKISGGTTTIYVNNLYECTDSGLGPDCEKHIFAGGKRIATKTSSTTYYYHPDHLGGLNVATDSSPTPTVQEKVFYYPYGENFLKQGNLDLKHKFTDQEKDSEIGIYYYKVEVL